MKKLLFLSLFISFLLWPSSSFAQSEKAGTITTQAIDLAKLDYRYNAAIEFFLQLTKEKKYQDAFNMTAGVLAQNGYENFVKIVNATGLTDFTEKKWLSFKDEMKSIGVTTVEGELKTPDGITHKITFHLIIGGETEIKIGAISEEVSVADLQKRFPSKEDLVTLATQDLRTLTSFIAKRKSQPLYNYLSTLGKQRTKVREVRKILSMFRKKKIKVTFPKKAVLTISEDSPKLNDQGLMVVKGSYANKAFVVNFTLAYDYEWQWKLGGFSLETKPK